MPAPTRETHNLSELINERHNKFGGEVMNEERRRIEELETKKKELKRRGEKLLKDTAKKLRSPSLTPAERRQLQEAVEKKQNAIARELIKVKLNLASVRREYEKLSDQLMDLNDRIYLAERMVGIKRNYHTVK